MSDSIIPDTLKPHFYIHFTGVENKTLNQIELGQFRIQKDKLKIAHIYKNIDDWEQALTACFEDCEDRRKNILLYIHGLWADNRWFVESSSYILQKEIFDNQSHQYGMTISVQWRAGLKYEDNVALALQKGKLFADIFFPIFKKIYTLYNKTKLSFLCHSMGNKFFEGVFNGYTKKLELPKFAKVMLFAAELPSDVFDRELNQLPNFCQNIYVFYNLNDRTLAIANFIKPHHRLGIYGIEHQSEIPKNINQIDTTPLIDDDESFGGKFTYHRYYYGSKTMRNYIVDILRDEI